MITATDWQKKFEHAIYGNRNVGGSRDGFELAIRVVGARPTPIIRVILRVNGREAAEAVTVDELEIGLRELFSVLRLYDTEESRSNGLIVRIIDALQGMPCYTATAADLETLTGVDGRSISMTLSAYARRGQYVERVKLTKTPGLGHARRSYRLRREHIACRTCREAGKGKDEQRDSKANLAA